MRDWWYGDKRDVVKWGAVLALARRRATKSVLQVAMYRADRPNYQLSIDETSEPLPIEVIRHFRDIEHIQRLNDATLAIDIHKALFQWSPNFPTRADFRMHYFEGVGAKIRQYGEAPLIVFLDPDTGIAPANYSYEHVTHQEIRTVLDAMKPGDTLLFYQHARLGDGNWLNSTKEEFRLAVGLGVPVETITCNEIASDMAFFVVDRSKWRGAQGET